MDMSGEFRLPVPREKVWEALNDPEVLQECIPGCESLERISDSDFSAEMLSKVGPVKAKFATKLTISEPNPPVSYSISGEGKGGAAGFAKGGAEVSLAEDGAETVLRYTAKVQVGGKLAQVGSRLIDGTARKMVDDFFGKFAELLTVATEPEDAIAPQPEASTSHSKRIAAVVGLVLIVALVVWAVSD